MAATLAELGVARAFVVHGAGGLDEISLAGDTLVAEVGGGKIKRYTVTPEDFGSKRASPEAIRGGSPAENAAILQAIFAGEAGPRRDIVVINSAAALVAAGVAENFMEGAKWAANALSSGPAQKKLPEQKISTTGPTGKNHGPGLPGLSKCPLEGGIAAPAAMPIANR